MKLFLLHTDSALGCENVVGGSAGMVGLHDLTGPLQPQWFCDL